MNIFSDATRVSSCRLVFSAVLSLAERLCFNNKSFSFLVNRSYKNIFKNGEIQFDFVLACDFSDGIEENNSLFHRVPC
jgi:hypothetical protein